MINNNEKHNNEKYDNEKSLSLISRYFQNCVASCTDCNSNCASWEGKIFSLRGFK